MILQYGDYHHGDNECEISIIRTPWKNNFGDTIGYTERWNVKGRLLATGADLVENLTMQIQDLIMAYEKKGKDVILLANTTPTAHKMYDENTFGGVQVIEMPTFPDGNGAEYATYRDYTLALEARFINDDAENLMSYSESISMQGSGRGRFVILEVLDGAPVKQKTSSRTACRLIQEGEATGLNEWPAPQIPIMSEDDMVSDSKNIIKYHPQITANGKYWEFRTTWHYEFWLLTHPAYTEPELKIYPQSKEG
jgi:hypothetical protein